MARWLGLALSIVAACSRPTPAPRDPTTVTSDGRPPAFPAGLSPGDALPPPAPPPQDLYGLSYLEAVYPRIRDGWTAFLEDCRLRLPPDHPLNGGTLEATVGIVADSRGRIIDAQLQRPSNNIDFDQAALDVAREAEPLPKVPLDLLSDDGKLYLTWLFARDQRQAGVATARVNRVEWPLERSVPRFLERGEIGPAAARVAAGGAKASTGAEIDPVMAMADRVFQAALREALRSAEPATQRLAITAAAEGKVAAASTELRLIATSSGDVATRAAALSALGAIRDDGAAPMLLATLEQDAGATAELTAASAEALAALGKGAEAAKVVDKWFAEGAAGQKGRTWAALIALGGVPSPSAVPELDRIIKAGEPRAAGLGCTALGTAAASSADVWKSLRKGLDSPDATVRAACARAAATAAAKGAKSRAAFWRSAELLRDRDERVRAAAVRAAARLDANRAQQELVVLTREQSPPVLIALAEAWGGMPGPPSKQLLTLAGHAEPSVRAAAVAALAARKDDASRAAAAARAVDPEPRVRVAAVPAVRNEAQLETLVADDNPVVRAAAQVALAQQRGRKAILVEQSKALAAAPPASPERVSLALGWILAR